MRQIREALAGMMITTLFTIFVAPSAMAAAQCDKPAGYFWTHAFYHDKNGNILQVEKLSPNQDLSDRKLKKIGNHDIPGCSPGLYEHYSCPAEKQVAIDQDAVVTIYYAAKLGEIEVNAYCMEKVRNVIRTILCSKNDPNDDDGNPACTFCYCATRPCPLKCCK